MPRSHGQISQFCTAMPGVPVTAFAKADCLTSGLLRGRSRSLSTFRRHPPGTESVLWQYRSDADSLHPDEPGASLYPHVTVLAAGDCTMLIIRTWPDSARPPGKPAWPDGCRGQNQLTNLWAAEHADRDGSRR
jgi:hypothetical protein